MIVVISRGGRLVMALMFLGDSPSFSSWVSFSPIVIVAWCCASSAVKMSTRMFSTFFWRSRSFWIAARAR